MIKAFLFDYDGVITKGVDVLAPAKRLAERTNVSVDQASKTIFETWDKSSTGKMTESDVWKHIEKKLDIKIDDEKKDIWFTWEELTPLPEMIDLVQLLKAHGFTVGLLSNVLKESADIIRCHGGYENFDFTVLSYEVGAKKPSPAIYANAMEHLPGIKPDEVYFFDDRQHCIDGAKEFGLNTVLVIDHQKLIELVKTIISTND